MRDDKIYDNLEVLGYDEYVRYFDTITYPTVSANESKQILSSPLSLNRPAVVVEFWLTNFRKH